MSYQQIMDHFPRELKKIYSYITELRFEEDPDYDYIYKELSSLSRPLITKTASTTISVDFVRFHGPQEELKE